MLTKEEATIILNKMEVNYSQQFLEFALRFNDANLLKEFCIYWKSKPAGGGDLSKFLTEHYTKRLGDKE